jgi:hypothetical protein
MAYLKDRDIDLLVAQTGYSSLRTGSGIVTPAISPAPFGATSA